MLSQTDIFIRILLAAALGGAVGFEREWSHKVAGLRTHALVAVGAALLSIVSISSFAILGLDSGTNYDPSRIISNIIVGIGFIGGGAILKNGNQVRGVTTAATLWIVAVIGIAIGVGFIREALFTTAVVYIVLTVLWGLEKKMTKLRRDPDQDDAIDK